MLEDAVRERIATALAFREPDRVPVCDFLLNKRVVAYFSGREAFDVAARVNAYHQLGIDVCWRFERRRNERDKSGLAEKIGAIDVPRRPRSLTEEAAEAELADFRAQQRLFAPKTHLAMSAPGCLSMVYRTLGFQDFNDRMYLEPLAIERFIEMYAEDLYVRAAAFARSGLGPLFFVTDDIAYARGLIFSQGFLRQYWLPRISQAIAPLKDAGIKVILHSAGNIGSLLEGIMEAGFDGIHPVDPSAGMDIGSLKKYAGRLLLFGNITLHDQKPEHIAGQVRECMRKAAAGGGFFIGCKHALDEKCDLRGILSFYTAIQEFGAYRGE